MATTLPGTTIEVSGITKGVSRSLFDGMFAAGGITLAQVSVMTGLEPYLIQNWIKRGFVSPPMKRQYSKNQFARIVIINMLRESLHLDRICKLLSYINGSLNDESDDLIGDSELYHMYVDLIAIDGGGMGDSRAMHASVQQVIGAYEEPMPGARERLAKILQVMAHAHFATLSRQAAEELLSRLE
ncbi:MAG: DUF1836 domain-containing protein [Clostridia bacterium]|nr:DUF1836 domain-containing protein [Clostridia bacterium]